MKSISIVILGGVILFSAWMCPLILAQCLSHTGDVNNDGVVSSGDAQIAFYIALGSYIPSNDEWCAADCNSDGVISSGDAQAIFYKALGMGVCASDVTPQPTPTPTPTEVPACMAGSLYSVDEIVGNMRCVPGGTFTQGAPTSESCYTDEHQFTHQLTRNIAVLETEVTRGMWEALAVAQPTLPIDPSVTYRSPTLSHPVQNNTWFEAVLFCNLLSLQNGFTQCYFTDPEYTNPITSSNYTTGPFYCDLNANGYRLPLEGEREYFTRAGTTGPFSCDDPDYTSDNCFDCILGTHPILEQYCVYCPNDPSGCAPVGSKLANPWNLYDVHGNVWEFCWDWCEPYPTGFRTDYTGTSSGSTRVIRGGAWSGIARGCRSAYRANCGPDDHSSDIGFRIVRLADDELPPGTITPVSTNTPNPTETPANTPTSPPECETGSLYSVDDIVGNMRCVEAGSLTQGSPGEEACRMTNETQFIHQLTRNICVMETEVTRQMWADLQSAQPSLPNDPSILTYSPGMNGPVQGVEWFKAVLYANLLSLENGYTCCYYKDEAFEYPVDASNYTTGTYYCDFDADGYRLPSEGEWEYFCRAGTTGVYSCEEPSYNSGNCGSGSCTPGTLPVLEVYCVFCSNNSGKNAVVGTKEANPWGLKDIHGNVYEWCWDWFAPYPEGSQMDYTGPVSGTARILRGGGWDLYSQFCRSAFCHSSSPEVRDNNRGFRLVRTLDIEPLTPTITSTPTGTPTDIPTPTPTDSPTPTGTPTEIPVCEAGSLFSVDEIVGNMRCVLPGSFTQGAPNEEACRYTAEFPPFTHTLSRRIVVMETEISRQMWADLKAVQSMLPDDPSNTTYSPTMNQPVQ